VSQTLKETIEFYNKLYESIKPNDWAFKRACELWDTWETLELKRPDINKILYDNDFYMNFFNEIVNFIFIEKKNIIYLPFLLNDFNYHAFTASDGYVVLCDERFDNLLQFIVTLCTFIACNEYNREERSKIENYLRNGIIKYYIEKDLDFLLHDNYINDLLKSSYDIGEHATYIWNAIRAFMFCHELGHHVLGHTNIKEMRLIQTNDKIYSYEIDSISILQEYSADDYAFDTFLKLSEVDEKRYYTFFKYRSDYAPLLFFDICHSIEKLTEIVTGNKIVHTKHPNPHKRKNKLRDTKIIRKDITYFNFRDVVFNIYKKY
jgi:hypothetical protein